MNVSNALKIVGMILLISAIPTCIFAQRDKSSTKRAAEYRSAQAKRKEQVKQEAERKAAKIAAEKAKEAAKIADARRKAEEVKARKEAQAAANQEKKAAKKQQPLKVELIEEKSSVVVKEQQTVAPPTDKKEETLDKIVETDVVPTIDLKTKSDGSIIGNLMAIFNDIGGSKKSKNQMMPEARKAKAENGVFEGIKVSRMFIRHASGFVEKFHYVKEFQPPPPNITELYYYNKLTGKITMRNPMDVGMTTFDKENFLLLHGPYIKTKGDQIYEQGSFYLGAKHQRWEKFDNNFVLQEKFYYNKGMAKDTELIYEEDTKGKPKLKEIVPLQHGLRHGTYIAYYHSGRVAERGQYIEGCKVGRWTEYYDRDKNPRKRETIYPRRAHDDTQPYISREWDDSGKLITDVRK
jgi:antitoxin component YwqK of YwqJK toxin-antitoxin module